MRRVEVSRRLGSVEEVRASLAAHRGPIADKLDAECPASPETGFSYQVMFSHMDDQLAKVESRLVEAEDRHVRQLVRIRRLRRRRDRGAASLYDKQTATRGTLAFLFGKERNFELAAVSGKTPQSSKALVEQVDQTVKLLREPEGASPSLKVAGIGVDFATMADDLEDGKKDLLRVRAELVKTVKKTDGTRQAANRASKGFDLVFFWIAPSLEGLFRLAGEQELAERIRTSVRRVTRRQAEPKDQTPASPEPSPGGPAPEASEPAPAGA